MTTVHIFYEFSFKNETIKGYGAYIGETDEDLEDIENEDYRMNAVYHAAYGDNTIPGKVYNQELADIIDDFNLAEEGYSDVMLIFKTDRLLEKNQIEFSHCYLEI